MSGQKYIYDQLYARMYVDQHYNMLLCFYFVSASTQIHPTPHFYKSPFCSWSFPTAFNFIIIDFADCLPLFVSSNWLLILRKTLLLNTTISGEGCSPDSNPSKWVSPLFVPHAQLLITPWDQDTQRDGFGGESGVQMKCWLLSWIRAVLYQTTM